MNGLVVGDVVISLKGRDKDKFFIVCDIKDEFCYIANGKERKVSHLKKKNVKHLRKVNDVSLTELALKIQKGDPVANKRVARAVKTAKK